MSENMLKDLRTGFFLIKNSLLCEQAAKQIESAIKRFTVGKSNYS